MQPIQTPKIFISYSWSSPEHEQWVIDLAENLMQDGIDIALDKWELREGMIRLLSWKVWLMIHL